MIELRGAHKTLLLPEGHQTIDKLKEVRRSWFPLHEPYLLVLVPKSYTDYLYRLKDFTPASQSVTARAWGGERALGVVESFIFIKQEETQA